MMRLTYMQETPNGYVLGQSRAVKAWTLGLCIFLLSFGVLPLLVAGKDALIYSVLIMALFSLIPAYLLYLAFGYRIVIDEKGIHRYSFRHVKRSLLWKDICSCGVGEIPVPYRYGHIRHLAFYASTEETPFDDDEKIFIKLNPTDERVIRKSQILDYCHAQTEAVNSLIAHEKEVTNL